MEIESRECGVDVDCGCFQSRIDKEKKLRKLTEEEGFADGPWLSHSYIRRGGILNRTSIVARLVVYCCVGYR